MTDGEPTLRDARAALGVTASATPAHVVTAFRHQARAVHPDVNHTDDAAARFAALVAAYHVALEAAQVDSDDAAELRREPYRRHDTVPVPSSRGTTVWEAGEPLLWVGPVVAHRGPWHP
jgi:hypothetical protein